MTAVDRDSVPNRPPVARGAARGSIERKPKANFETWSWYFMRISGLILLFLALIHFALTHILNDVVDTDAEFVGERWENPLWRLFDWGLLSLALVHGVNGVRWSIDDYVRQPGRRAALKALLYTVTGGLFAYGTLIIISF